MVELTAEQDHQRLLDLLHITALRPGVTADGTGLYPVNYDESKANPWPTLPDPLVLATANQCPRRRYGGQSVVRRLSSFLTANTLAVYRQKKRL